MQGMETSDHPKMPKKRGRKPKWETEMNNGKTSSSPVTRSKVAPDWTTKESLILVNEIAAVEGDCLKVLSSYQKWKIIVENCSILDVYRPLNQCRSKWNSLLADYNRIKQWDSKSSDHDSYWLLDPQNRPRFQLPEDFDYDLFKAIDDYVRPQMGHPEADPDIDPEAEADLLHDIAILGSKRHRQRSISLKVQAEEISQNYCTIDELQIINAGEEPQQGCKNDNLQICYEKEKPLTIRNEEEPQKGLMEEKCPESCRIESPEKIHVEGKHRDSLFAENLKGVCTHEEKITGTEEIERLMVEKLHGNAELMQGGVQGNLPEIDKFGEQNLLVEKPKIVRQRKNKREELMVEKLRGNAEFIRAIVEGNLPETTGFRSSDSKSKESQPDMIRRQGDKLIACLGDIVCILDQFPFLVQECDHLMNAG